TTYDSRRKLQNSEMSVRKHADVGGDLERALGDVPGTQGFHRQQGPGGGQRVVAAGADGHDPVVGLDQLAGSAQEKAVVEVGDDEQCLQAAQDPVASPVLGQIDGGA